MGKGFALRWCKKHEVIIGSRDAERAATQQKLLQKIIHWTMN